MSTTKIQTAGEQQESQLMAEVVSKIEKHGERFSELDAKTQKDLTEKAKAISALDERIDSLERLYRATAHSADQFLQARLRDEQTGRNDGYPFRDRAEAAAFGTLFVRAYNGGNFDAQGFLRQAGFTEEFCKAGFGPQVAAALGLHKAATEPTSGPAGGYLMPPEFVQGIIRNVEMYGVIERKAFPVPLSSIVGFRTKRTGGLTCFYPDLGVSPTKSTMTFGQIKYNLTRYSAYTAADRFMLAADLIVPLAQLIATELALAIAFSTDRNGFVGDGTDTFARVVGLFNRAATGDGSVLRVTADTGDNTFQEVIDATTKYLSSVAGALPDWADARAEWYMHREIFWKYLGTREATTNRPLADILTSGSRPQRVLNGYNVEVSQVCPKMSDSGATKAIAILADLAAALDLPRLRNPELRQSEHVEFLQGRIAWVLDSVQDIALADGNACVQLVTAAS